ncbi:MAG: cytochrome c biogenesis protein ResB [Thermodesulfobacteriota bacterium]
MSQTKKTDNPLSQALDFFASVKLALGLLIALAATSILGTILPQDEPLAFYSRHYTPLSVRLIGFFQLNDMYHSWWFQWLLLLLTANLVVCSLKRFPTVWKVARSAPRSVSERLFETLPFHRTFSIKETLLDPSSQAHSLVGHHFRKFTPIPSADGTAFYLEKGRFSRFGVYLVHLSVLIIFLGAIIGSLFGFKGFLELKEGETADRIFLKSDHTFRELGYSVQLERFTMTLYPNKSPKEYRSDLLFREGGEIKERAVVRVNSPFSYKGINFYQSSWDKFPHLIKLQLVRDGKRSEIVLKMEEKIPLTGTPFSLQAVRYINDMANFGPALGVILFEQEQRADVGLILVNHPDFHGNRLGEFQVRVLDLKTQYQSGFQVNRDPGVWFIWIGASLMLLGFIVAFYFSHQQVWIWIREEKASPDKGFREVRIGGTAHKNRAAFIRKMEKLTEKHRSG